MEGFKDFPIEKLGTLITRQAPEKVSAGYSVDVRNCRWAGDVVRLRPGSQTAFPVSTQSRVTSLAQFEATDLNSPGVLERINVVYTSDGNLEREVSNGSRNSQVIGAYGGANYAQFTTGYNRLFMAFSDLNATPGSGNKQYYKFDDTMHVDDIGLAANATPPAGSNIEPAGNIETGDRFVVVAGITKTGYISGVTTAAIQTVSVGAAGHKVRVFGIPVFPQANVVARALFFTISGGSSSGPWFYIPADDVSDGITMTSTVINDNTTVELVVNFTDEYLLGLDDLTNILFDQHALEPQVGTYFSKSQKRMFYWGADSDTVRVSEIDDPETFLESQGYVIVGQGDGEKVTGVIDWKTQTLIMKDNSGYIVADTSAPPNKWPVPRRWLASGPVGPRAYDACEDFIAIASKCGLHIYEGDVPKYMSYFFQPTWDRINWDYQQLVWVKVDTNRQEILIGVPFDNSTIPNKVLCLDISKGLDNMRLSIDDISAHYAVEVKRNMPAPANPQDVVPPSLKDTQILLPTSNANGLVLLQDPTAITDNGVAIDQWYQFAYVSPKGISGVFKLGGIDIRLGGVGEARAWAYRIMNGTIDPEPVQIGNTRRPISLNGRVTAHHRNLDGINAERFSIAISNNYSDMAAFELHAMCLWMSQIWENSI